MALKVNNILQFTGKKRQKTKSCIRFGIVLFICNKHFFLFLHNIFGLWYKYDFFSKEERKLDDFIFSI